MADHDAPGSKTVARLAGRSAGLQRKEMSDGGEVYTGAIARKALRAVGARAMTLDRSIIVDEGFSPDTNVEDASLYAHEQLHLRESGGTDIHTHRDAEEQAAQAVESMVLHRAAKGQALPSIVREMKEVGIHDAIAMRDGNANAANGSGGAAHNTTGQASPAADANEAQAALDQLLATGMKYPDVVKMLAQTVLQSIDRSRHLHNIRATPMKTM